MYEDGYENISNIDISFTITKYMEDRCRMKYPEMKCNSQTYIVKTMDVLDMSEFKSGDFNVVVDKGTLDSILCGDNSEPNAHKMLSEIYRVLNPNGTYICITYGDEEHRRKYLVR
jgi:ubiquinone/menaquinone biosynthesis C-methylase UbiE